MALKAAIVMSIISIALLVIYGADVVSAGSEKTGFLRMDPSIRGSIFGIIPSVMLILSYFITKKVPSKKVGGLIIAGGALIITGIVMIIVIQGSVMTERGVGEFGAVLVIGIFIAILGGIKIKKSPGG
jgi:hypothetical protein